MNEPQEKDGQLGLSLLSIGVGIYLLGLELVRLLNSFFAELSAVTQVGYLFICIICSILITSGVIIAARIDRRLGIVVALLLGIVCFCFFGIGLVYGAYFIPYTQHWHFQVTDWLLCGTICGVGILLSALGCRSLAKRKGLWR